VSEVDWPPEFGERTPASQRRTTRRFEVDRRQAIEDLAAELDRLDVDDWTLQTQTDHRSDRPNIPYANAPEPEDPAAVVRWTVGGDQFAVGCDHWTRLRDNLREIGLYVREKRKMESRPVATGEAEFSNLRLPAPEDVPPGGVQQPHQVLGVEPDASPDAVREAYRERVKEAHPDRGGTASELEAVRRAKEVPLDE
jgi:hypothetical protein